MTRRDRSTEGIVAAVATHTRAAGGCGRMWAVDPALALDALDAAIGAPDPRGAPRVDPQDHESPFRCAAHVRDGISENFGQFTRVTLATQEPDGGIRFAHYPVLVPVDTVGNAPRSLRQIEQRVCVEHLEAERWIAAELLGVRSEPFAVEIELLGPTGEVDGIREELVEAVTPLVLARAKRMARAAWLAERVRVPEPDEYRPVGVRVRVVPPGQWDWFDRGRGSVVYLTAG